MALSYSKDLVVWGKVELKDIEKVAEKLHQWMLNKYNVKPVPVAVVQKPVEQEGIF